MPPSAPRTVQRAPLPSVNTRAGPSAALLRRALRSLHLRSGSPQSAQRRGCSFPPCPRKVPLRRATGPPRPAGCSPASGAGTFGFLRDSRCGDRGPVVPAHFGSAVGSQVPSVPTEDPRGDSEAAAGAGGWGAHGRGGPIRSVPWDRGVPAGCPRGSGPVRGGRAGPLPPPGPLPGYGRANQRSPAQPGPGTAALYGARRPRGAARIAI